MSGMFNVRGAIFNSVIWTLCSEPILLWTELYWVLTWSSHWFRFCFKKWGCLRGLFTLITCRCTTWCRREIVSPSFIRFADVLTTMWRNQHKRLQFRKYSFWVVRLLNSYLDKSRLNQQPSSISKRKNTSWDTPAAVKYYSQLITN